MAPATCTRPSPVTSPRLRAVAAVSSEAVAPAHAIDAVDLEDEGFIGAVGVLRVLAERDAVRLGEHGLAAARIAGELHHVVAGRQGAIGEELELVGRGREIDRRQRDRGRRSPPETRESWTVCPGMMVPGSIGPLISTRMASGELSRTVPAAGSDASIVGAVIRRAPGRSRRPSAHSLPVAPSNPLPAITGENAVFPAPLMATK